MSIVKVEAAKNIIRVRLKTIGVTDTVQASIVTKVSSARIKVIAVNLRGEKGADGHTPTSAELTALITPLAAFAADANFVFIQIAAANVWTVNHNLNKYPSVTIVDSAGAVVIGDVHYTDTNSLTVTFSAPFGGQAILN